MPHIAPAILHTVLGQLATLFLPGAGGDINTARAAAAAMLAGYNAETADELRLAAEVISFGFHALDALAQASSPDLPLNKVLRLRGSAVSLSREGHKAQRKLDQLQRTRSTEAAARPQATVPKTRPQPVTPAVQRGHLADHLRTVLQRPLMQPTAAPP